MTSRPPKPPAFPFRNSKNDTELISNMYDKFTSSNNVENVLSTFNGICSLLQIKQSLSMVNFLQQLKTKLVKACPKSKRLVEDLFLVAKQKGCMDTPKTIKTEGYITSPSTNCCAKRKILIVGAGPTGLRMAIESRFLGADVVIVDSRTTFARYNIAYLWQQAVDDLQSLKPRHFCSDFFTGSHNTISIRQLQFLLLKYALCLGVECHFGVTYDHLIEPTESTGWRAKFTPNEINLENFEYDVLVDATGRRNSVYDIDSPPKNRSLDGRKVGKKMIAIAASFVNSGQMSERYPQVNSVNWAKNENINYASSLEKRGFNVETIVYFRRETHYFIFTLKVNELLKKKIIHEDIGKDNLRKDNVNADVLKKYVRDIANELIHIVLNPNDNTEALMRLETFNLNEHQEEDVGIFNFEASGSAFNSSKIIERKGKMLFMSLVGDSLISPFWPEGTGVVKGFMSVLDLCWILLLWSSNERKITPLQLLGEKEFIYSQLRYMDKHPKPFRPSLDPVNRYRKSLLTKKNYQQIAELYDTDIEIGDVPFYKAAPNLYHHDLQFGKIIILDQYNKYLSGTLEKSITDCCTCWRDGHALLTVINLWSPNLVDLNSLAGNNILSNQIALNIIAVEWGIPPPFTASKMAGLTTEDEGMMLNYLYSILQLLSNPENYFTGGSIHRKRFTGVEKFNPLQQKKIAHVKDENANLVKIAKFDQKAGELVGKRTIIKYPEVPKLDVDDDNIYGVESEHFKKETNSTLKEERKALPVRAAKSKASRAISEILKESKTSKLMPKLAETQECTPKATSRPELKSSQMHASSYELPQDKSPPSLTTPEKSSVSAQSKATDLASSSMNFKREIFRHGSIPTKSSRPTLIAKSEEKRVALPLSATLGIKASAVMSSESIVKKKPASDKVVETVSETDYDYLNVTPAKPSLYDWKRRGSVPNIHMSGTSGKYCAVCDKLVYQAVKVRISKAEIVHRLCFHCSICAMNLIRQPFIWYSSEGCFYCLEHEPTIESDEEVVEYCPEDVILAGKKAYCEDLPKTNLKLQLNEAEIDIECNGSLSVRVNDPSKASQTQRRNEMSCGTSESSKPATIQRVNSYTHLDQIKSQETCHSCKFFVRSSNAVHAAGYVFHVNCLKCSKCLIYLTENNFYYDRQTDKFFCVVHRQKLAHFKPKKQKLPFKLPATPKTSPLSKFAGVLRKFQ
ncbi:hypothetical protein CHUAL_003283 [Chamberlinius hualienensis]